MEKTRKRLTHEANSNGIVQRLWIEDAGTDCEPRYTLTHILIGEDIETNIRSTSDYGLILSFLKKEMAFHKEMGMAGQYIPRPELDTPDDTPQPTYETLKDTLENNTDSQ